MREAVRKIHGLRVRSEGGLWSRTWQRTFGFQ